MLHCIGEKGMHVNGPVSYGIILNLEGFTRKSIYGCFFCSFCISKCLLCYTSILEQCCLKLRILDIFGFFKNVIKKEITTLTYRSIRFGQIGNCSTVEFTVSELQQYLKQMDPELIVDILQTEKVMPDFEGVHLGRSCVMKRKQQRITTVPHSVKIGSWFRRT